MDFLVSKEKIEKLIYKMIIEVYGIRVEKLQLTYPPNISMGDFSFSCHKLAKVIKRNPVEIAESLVNHYKLLSHYIKTESIIKEIKNIGPFINVFLHDGLMMKTLSESIVNYGDDFLMIDSKVNETIMVEYLSPNTNKPLHLGHVRNGVIGMALSNMFSSIGYKVVKSNLINDRGIHICKSMLAWQKWGKGTTPESEGIKGDHFVGKWYVRYDQEEKKDPSLKEEAMLMLKKWEAGDEEIWKLWQMMNSWVFSGFDKTYEEYGFVFDQFYYESDTYKLGKNIVEDGIKNGVFQYEKGPEIKNENVIYLLSKYNFGIDENRRQKKATLLRPNGTSLYLTQDIGTAVLKAEQYDLDRSIYVVGSEQDDHFKRLFEILDALGYDWAKGLYHFSYGMVYLPEGRMKSREGTVVDADNLVSEVTNLAKMEILKRYPSDFFLAEEIEKMSKIIALGAIKFQLIKTNPNKDINFNPKESISFEGFTGPYCQYAYARIHGILDKLENQFDLNNYNIDYSILQNSEERILIQKLFTFSEIVKTAIEDYMPSKIAVHIYEIAKAFNQFYNKHRVLLDDDDALSQARLALIVVTARIIKKGLNLIGIDILEKM